MLKGEDKDANKWDWIVGRIGNYQMMNNTILNIRYQIDRVMKRE